MIRNSAIGWETLGPQTDVFLVTSNKAAAESLKSPAVIFAVNPEARAGPLDEKQLAPAYDQYPVVLAYQFSASTVSGIQVAGASIEEDMDANERIYGKRLGTKGVFALAAAYAEPPIESLLSALKVHHGRLD